MSQNPRFIPIPLAQRLQDLRTKIVPHLVFGTAVIMAALLWRNAITPSMLVGEVTTLKSTVSSPVPAAILRLNSQRFQMVKAGEVIAELRPNDPRQALDMMQGELTLLRLEVSTDDSANGSALSLERLSLDLLSEKVALTLALADARKADLDLQLAQKMVNSSTDSGRYVQVAELAKDKADNAVKARQALVDTIGPRVEKMRGAMPAFPPTQDARLKKLIESLQLRLGSLEQNQNVITLLAPIDGMVTEVLHRAGENVIQGQPLIVITATQPESIVGYLRQPFPFQPAVGQTVEVRTNGRDRQHGTALVTRVGVHFELIQNPTLHPATTPEVGVPVEISLPANLHLRPGELVGLVIRSADTPKSSL